MAAAAARGAEDRFAALDRVRSVRGRLTGYERRTQQRDRGGERGRDPARMGAISDRSLRRYLLRLYASSLGLRNSS